MRSVRLPEVRQLMHGEVDLSRMRGDCGRNARDRGCCVHGDGGPPDAAKRRTAPPVRGSPVGRPYPGCHRLGRVGAGSAQRGTIRRTGSGNRSMYAASAPPVRTCEAGPAGAMSGAVVITMPGSAGCRPPGRGPRRHPDPRVGGRAGSAGASARPRGARRPARARLFDCAYMNSPASREYVQRESAFLSVGAAETDRSEGAHAQHTRIRPHRAERAHPHRDR